jgi:hypothetical protein
MLELTPDGTDYLAHDRVHEDSGTEIWQVVRLVLDDALERLTQRQLLEEWPEDFRKPDQSTLSRELGAALDKGLIMRRGTGRKNDPYQYWLPGKEEDFHPGPHATKEELERFQRRWEQRWLESLTIAPGDRKETKTEASSPARALEQAAELGESKAVANAGAAEVHAESVNPARAGDSLPAAAVPPAEPAQAGSELCGMETPANGSKAVMAQAAEPAIAMREPAGSAPESVSPSLAAPPFVLSPLAVPTKEEAERAAEVARERRRVRRWPHG